MQAEIAITCLPFGEPPSGEQTSRSIQGKRIGTFILNPPWDDMRIEIRVLGLYNYLYSLIMSS